MLRTTYLFAILSMTALSVSAAGIAHVRIVPRSTVIRAHETVAVDIFVDYSNVTGPMGQAPDILAGFKFDVLGDPFGTLAGQANSIDLPWFVSHGIPSGPNLLDMSAGQLSLGLGGTYTGGFLGTVFYTDSGAASSTYQVRLRITDYVSPEGALGVYYTEAGLQSRPSYDSHSGGSHLVTFDRPAFKVITPAPAAAAPLGLMLLAAHRRR